MKDRNDRKTITFRFELKRLPEKHILNGANFCHGCDDEILGKTKVWLQVEPKFNDDSGGWPIFYCQDCMEAGLK